MTTFDPAVRLALPIIGCVFICLGLALMVATIRLFVTVGKGTLAPWNPTQQLVVQGIYRHVRNPMISSVFCILLGEALVAASLQLFQWFLLFVVINAVYIPLFGEPGLVKRFGEERAKRIALYNRNLFVFPNLVVNDIMAVTIRTYYPQAPDFMTVSAWALAPKEETDWARKYRLFNFLEFLGPGGFATPDDVEALEQCQRGFRNSAEAQWNDISKGMGKQTPAYDDELQMRAFWSSWNQHVFQASV